MNPRHAGRLVALLAPLAAGAAEYVAPQVSESIDYYVFGGSTVAEMSAQLAKLGPKTAEGNFHAFTSWYVKWNYDYDRSSGSCGLGPVRTTVTVNYRLPKWARPKAPQDLAEKWYAYATALRRHEDGHRDFGVEAGRAVARALAQLPRQSSCDQLEALADRTGERILQEAHAHEVEYDRRTNHGAKQGALFR